MQYKVIVLTSKNQAQYIEQLIQLEQDVIEKLKKDGKENQFFATGKEDICEYVLSKNHIVIIGVDCDNKMLSAAYIKYNQIPFTNNDIIKYFKYGENYNDYVKSKYETELEYKYAVIETYKQKLEAFKYAKNNLMLEYPEFVINGEFDFKRLLEDEIKRTNFREGSALRVKINSYMYDFFKNKNNDKELQLYDDFYWLDIRELSKIFGKKMDINMCKDNTIVEYENFLKASKLKIYEELSQNQSKYYEANTSNSIEIDTYITNPNNRSNGIARILVYEGIKKAIMELFKNSNNKDIYLCSTLHRENVSSKYVSEFFGLRDNVYVKRSTNVDRQVHIKRISKDKANSYFEDIEDKLILLYGYNPSEKKLTIEKQINILKEQRNYEVTELKKILKLNIKTNVEKKYSLNGESSVINTKIRKIRNLNNRLENLKIKKSQERGSVYEK